MGNESLEKTRDFLSFLFPDLVIKKISPLGEGWDSKAFSVNKSVVFRIPKRTTVARRMKTEIQLLHAIKPYLYSTQIPDIKWIGPARDNLAVSAIGYPKIEGVPFSNIVQGTEMNHIFPEIGQFLNELHTVPKSVFQTEKVPWFRWTGDGSESGPDGWEIGLRTFTERIRVGVLPLLSKSTATAVDNEINIFLTNKQNFGFEPVLLHGDLTQEHILVNKETDTIGVIDFGDSGFGDPAYDVWPQLTPYYSRCGVDETFKIRQRFYRKLAPFHGVISGLMVEDDEMVIKGLDEIERAFGTVF
ncbi:aminoglycoside phosphotransferase family protein [Lentibacillus sp. N15]|uniref:phosphotransferase family protein n=1 Tax=Lentibacillus songyuanensis TaxID=3136161 RepID=UPI0031BAAC7F